MLRLNRRLPGRGSEPDRSVNQEGLRWVADTAVEKVPVYGKMALTLNQWTCLNASPGEAVRLWGQGYLMRLL